MGKMLIRSYYLSRLRQFQDVPSVIKVITGMRRCGKSTLLEQFVECLRGQGVDESHICFINFELFEGQELSSSERLRKHLRNLPTDSMTYVLLDEVQDVDGWERIVSALEASRKFDIYLTGSNSDMLSTDLATHLSGRYLELRMLPFSFAEYLELHPGDTQERFVQYMRYGGIPDVDPDRGDAYCMSYLDGVFNTVLVKDILSRLRTDDVGKVGSIARFLYSNIGNVTNRSAIAKGTGLSQSTVDRYVDEMGSALLFYYAERYDLVGKRLLSTNGKYYASDLGLRTVSLRGAVVPDLSRPLENIVFLELVRRGYTVRVGSYRDYEVDFTVLRGDRTEYYQVAQSVMSQDTKEREIRPLRAIRDNYRKTILTLDRFGLGSDLGIEIVNVVDWLLDEKLSESR